MSSSPVVRSTPAGSNPVGASNPQFSVSTPDAPQNGRQEQEPEERELASQERLNATDTALFRRPAPDQQLAATEDDAEVACQLTRSDRRFLIVTAAILLTLSGIHWAQLSGFGLREIEIDRLPGREFEFQIDVNTANWVEWMQLEGIGDLTARKIVADRDTRGPFQSIDDLTRVSGIGPKTLAKIRAHLTCEAGLSSRERTVQPRID